VGNNEEGEAEGGKSWEEGYSTYKVIATDTKEGKMKKGGDVKVQQTRA
jgi:hypothetical protein